MFGFGNRQKKEEQQETNQEDFFFDEYEDDGYEEDYGYDEYDEGYDHPSREELDSERPTRRPRERAEVRGGHSEQEEFQQVEINRLEETVAQLKHQLEVKQSELNNMAGTITEKEKRFNDEKIAFAGKQTELDNQINELKDTVKVLEEQLEEATKEKEQSIDTLQKHSDSIEDTLTETTEMVESLQAQLEKAQAEKKNAVKEARQEARSMEEELASILVDTRKKEREALDRAEFDAKKIRTQAEQEAQRLIHDASLELRVLKQEIINYRKRLRSVQEENSQFFNRLLANSEQLLDED